MVIRSNKNYGDHIAIVVRSQDKGRSYGPDLSLIRISFYAMSLKAITGVSVSIA